MKFLIIFAIVCFAYLLNQTKADAANLGNLTVTTQSNKSTRSCLRRVRNSCSSTLPACARIGRANLCRAFRNDCARQRENCRFPVQNFKAVPNSLCRGIIRNQMRPCVESESENRAKNPSNHKIVDF